MKRIYFLTLDLILYSHMDTGYSERYVNSIIQKGQNTWYYDITTTTMITIRENRLGVLYIILEKLH